MTKSKVAFFFNCELIAARRGNFLWTFTMAETVSYTEFRKRWNQLLTVLRRELPEWKGVRVFEPHPGAGIFRLSHGLHAHVLTDSFFEYQKIKAICKRQRWGICHVARLEKCEHGAKYLAKYLSKKRPHSLKGWRLWQCFGSFDRSKVCNIVVDSFQTRLWRWAADNWSDWHSATFSERIRGISRFAHFCIETNRDILPNGEIYPPLCGQEQEFVFIWSDDLGTAPPSGYQLAKAWMRSSL